MRQPVCFTSIPPLWFLLFTTPTLADQNIIQGPTLAIATQIVLESHVSGAPHSWLDETSGETGTVTPVRTFKSKSGLFCRVYEIRMGDSPTNLHRACRSQGVWIEVKAP